MKRTRHILLSAVFMLAMVIGMAMTARAASGKGLWVGNSAEVTGAGVIQNTGATKGTASVAIRNGSIELTLNNFQYKGPGHRDIYNIGNDDRNPVYGPNAGIFYSGTSPLSIIIKGENAITATPTSNNYEDCKGIYIDALHVYKSVPVSIGGSGSLTLKSDQSGISCVNGNFPYSNSLIINGGNINATGTKREGILADTITINGGTINAAGPDAIYAMDELTINGGNVTATGYDYGLCSHGGDIVINGGTVRAVGEGNGVCFKHPTGCRLIIGDKVNSFFSSGTFSAIGGYVKNAIAGTAWEDVAGTVGRADIAVRTSDWLFYGNYQSVQFPAVEKPADNVQPNNKQDQQPETQVQVQRQIPITISKAPFKVKAEAKGKNVIVSWAKLKKGKKNKALLKKISKIEIQISTDRDFKNIVKTRTIGKKRNQVTIKLGKKMTYYVRERYVGNDGGVSNWSKVRRVRTK